MGKLPAYNNADTPHNGLPDRKQSGADPCITVTLPWPPLALTPNTKRRKHWGRYVGPARKYRAECWAETLGALLGHRFGQPPSVEIHFYPPDARHRDDDGMIGAFKNGRDGVADAIRWDDKHWRPTYHFHPPHRPGGKIVVILRERRP